jgi:gluconate 2-dehydrogenase gamma chain
MTDLSRRTLIKATGAVGAAATGALGAALVQSTLPVEGAKAQPVEGGPTTSNGYICSSVPREMPPTNYLFFNTEEAAFIEAAVARLIPADEEWLGALEAGVPNYIDKQQAGAWGAGERLYRSGPWQSGARSQGYQLPYTPAELFRTALAAINKQLASTPFASMSADDQDAYLRKLDAGGQDLGGVPSEEFFGHLWQSTLEGFFCDPVYGGNYCMVSWRMIGFPGAYASYYDVIDQHGIKYDREPMSLAEDAHGHIHLDPGIPASSP